MSHVLEITNVEHLQPYRSHWQRLLKETPNANFFQSLEWLEVYWRHFGNDQELRVLLQIEDGELAGIVPLTLKSEETQAGKIRFLTYPLDFWGSFYGPISARPQETLAAALDYLRQRKRDWDVLELRWSGAFSIPVERSEAALSDAGFGCYRTEPETGSVIELNGSWNDYLATRTPKYRNNLRRSERRLAEQAEVTHLRYRPAGVEHGDGDPRWDLFEQCLDVSRRSWQGDSTTGTTLSHESVASFLRDLHQVAAECGGLDVNLLYLDGRPVAYAYNYVLHGSVFGLRSGYDEEYKCHGVGAVLYARAIEGSFARGDWLYDLGPGSTKAKRHIYTAACPLSRFTHFPLGSLFSVRPNLLRIARLADNRKTGRQEVVAKV